MAKTKVEDKEEIKDEGSKTILDIIQENIEKFSKYFNKNTKSGEEPEMYPLIIFDTYEDFVEYKKYDKTGAGGIEKNILVIAYKGIQQHIPMTWEKFLATVFQYGYVTGCKNCWNCYELIFTNEGLENCINCFKSERSKNCKDCGYYDLTGSGGNIKDGVVDSNNCINCIECEDCNNCINCENCYKCNDCINCINSNCCIQCIYCEDCDSLDDKYSINCQYCNRCYGCKDCINCSYDNNTNKDCNWCEKCGNCKGCESCIKCKNCVNCTGCEECIDCNSCETCYDCDESDSLESQAHMYKTWEKNINDNYLRNYFYSVN